MRFKRIRLSDLLVFAWSVSALVQPAVAATITVDLVSPGVGVVVVDAADGRCSLREAIANANNDAATHADCAAGSGADTIVLPAGATFKLPDAAVVEAADGNSGLPSITDALTIEGNGSIIERDGTLPCNPADFSQSASEFRLIYVELSGLTINDATLRNGCIDASVTLGGGAILANADLTLAGVTVIDNIVGNAGGGVDTLFGKLQVTGSLFASNTSLYGDGGGIASADSTTLRNTTFSSNTAQRGGALFVANHNKTHALENVTFADNTATSAGGGIYNSNTTVNGKNLVLQNSTCAENSAIFTPVWNAAGANFDSGTTCSASFGANFTGSATLNLGPLADNASPTKTHALGPGSQAIDAVAAADCSLSDDQRGFSRPQDGDGNGTSLCDAGAYELLAVLTAPATIHVDETSPGSGVGVIARNRYDDLCSLREAIDNANATSTALLHPDCEPGFTSGSDTIILPALASFTLTYAASIHFQGNTGLPPVRSTITMQGNGSRLQRSSALPCNINGSKTADEFRILRVESSGNLTLEDASISNGCADPSPGNGAAGGGIKNEGRLTLRRVEVVDNRAHDGGGGIGSDIEQPVLIEDSLIANNSAQIGGAVFARTGMTIRNSTISNNVANNAGGGVYLTLQGAGVHTLEHVTFSGNTAFQASGIYLSSGTVRAQNIVLDGQTCIKSGTFTASGANFDSGTSCAELFGANFTSGAVLNLGPLADNGGPTRTHALGTGSDAIDAVGATDCTRFGSTTAITTDQRGENRPLDGDGDGTPLCDAGAFEVAPLAIDDVTQVEGNAGASTFTFTLSRGASTIGDATVQVDTADVSAVAGSDYTAIAGQTATIPDGATSTTVGVTVAGDAVHELNETFNVTLANATNGSLVDASGLGTIANDDAPPTLSIDDVTLAEGDAGPTAFTFTVTKTGATEVTATVDASSADGTATTGGNDYTALPPTTLTFAPGETGKTVTVTVNGDLLAENDETVNVDLTNATQATIGDDRGLGTITNDDFPGVSVSKTTATTSETGTTDAFTYILDAQPSADVMVALTTGDAAEGLLTDADETSQASVTLIFTPANWNVAQQVTITGQDDVLTDGDQIDDVTATTTSTDPLWGGLTVPAIAVTNADDDTPGVDLAPVSGLVTTEAGGTATFDAVLRAQPAADVTIDFVSSDTTEGLVSSDGATQQSTVTLTFTAANWNVPQTVTLHGQDDVLTDGDRAYSITSSPVSSADGAWNGIAVVDVAATNQDDEVSAITITPTAGLITNEAGGTDSFTMVLTSQPTADVVIGVSSSNTAEGVVVPGSVTFTSANWSVAQTITVTGIDDVLADGDQAYSIVTADTVSADPGYDGLVVPDVTVTNLDDETSANDGDGDGVDDVVEDGGPNGGDANDDGIADAAQPSVATLPAANGNGFITLMSTCQLRDVEALLKDGFEPTVLLFPYALVEFRLPCATADMTVLYHAGVSWDASLRYWKYGPETPGQSATTTWYELPGVVFDTTTVGGVTVARAQFSLADGALGDDTGVDGEIIDQGGPGGPPPVHAVPTASEWMLLLLGIGLATLAVSRLR